MTILRSATLAIVAMFVISGGAVAQPARTSEGVLAIIQVIADSLGKEKPGVAFIFGCRENPRIPCSSDTMAVSSVAVSKMLDAFVVPEGSCVVHTTAEFCREKEARWWASFDMISFGDSIHVVYVYVTSQVDISPYGPYKFSRPNVFSVMYDIKTQRYKVVRRTVFGPADD